MTPMPKDTVRQRKGSALASTQRFLPVAEVRNNAIILKNGGVRGVLEVEALNYNLKSETEQQAIIAGYGAFVNTLPCPIQIIVRSRKMNIDGYIENIRSTGEKQTNPLLKEQTLNYASFIQKLVDVADIMQKKFYIVIPIDRSERHKTMIEQFFDWLHPDDSSAKASQRSHEFTRENSLLSDRMELVSSGLSNIGLHIKRLQTRDLISLLYETYNPKTSQTQKIPSDEKLLKLEANAL